MPPGLGAATDPAPLSLSSEDRLLILAPHPDDDVLCCGGLLQEALRKKAPVRVVYLTYGDNYEWAFMAYKKHPVLEPSAVRAMGLLRHDEALAGEKILGVAPSALTFLGYPDFGTMKIWTSHWGQTPAYKSMLTRVSAVPYGNARRPGAAYRGEEILKDLREILLDLRPTKIFVSHPEDQHPDHRALPLFLNVALWELKDRLPPPTLFAYMVHAKGWPDHRTLLPEKPLAPPDRLKNDGRWRAYSVPAPDLEKKFLALSQHKTQFQHDRAYLSSFIRSNELFNEIPSIFLSTPATDLSPASVPATLEVEPAALVGLVRKSVRIEQGQLVLSARFSRPLAEETGVILLVYGARSDRPFSEMPKIRVQSGPWRHRVFDGSTRLPWNCIHVLRQSHSITVWIPMSLLGNPQRLLASARSTLVFPLDWATWHILETVPTPRTFHPFNRKKVNTGDSQSGK